MPVIRWPAHLSQPFGMRRHPDLRYDRLIRSLLTPISRGPVRCPAAAGYTSTAGADCLQQIFFRPASFRWSLQVLHGDSGVLSCLYPPRLPDAVPCSYWALACVAAVLLHPAKRNSCFSGQQSASGFQQVPPHGGHPSPLAKPSRCRAISGLSPYRARTRRATPQKEGPQLDGPFVTKKLSIAGSNLLRIYKWIHNQTVLVEILLRHIDSRDLVIFVRLIVVSAVLHAA